MPWTAFATGTCIDVIRCVKLHSSYAERRELALSWVTSSVGNRVPGLGAFCVYIIQYNVGVSIL